MCKLDAQIYDDTDKGPRIDKNEMYINEGKCGGHEMCKRRCDIVIDYTQNLDDD